MVTFMGIAVGILIGGFLGATGMYLFIKDTHLDSVLEREAEEAVKVTFEVGGEKLDAFSHEIERSATSPVPEVDWETPNIDEIAKEVEYGDF